MWKIIAGVGAGILVGHFVVPMLVPEAAAAEIPQQAIDAADMNLRDHAMNMVGLCDDLRPVLLQLSAALQDNDISPGEGMALYRQVQRHLL